MAIKRYMERNGILVPDLEIPVPTARLGGFYRIQLKTKTGRIRKDTGWFRNIITDLGMDQYGVGIPGTLRNPLPWTCCVGTGTATPVVSDTTLQSPLAISGVVGPPSSGTYVAGPPAYNASLINWAFPLGAVIGNISEVGAGTFNSTSSFTLANWRAFSRQLILDGLGNPTTIAVTSSDQLNVSYEVRLYYDLTDSTVAITISGTSYGGTIRRALTGSAGTLNQRTGTPGWGPTTLANIYTGGIGLTSSAPGGSSLTSSGGGFGTYTPGSFTNTITSTWGTTNVGTIISGLLGANCLGWWQFQLLPGFAKTASNTLSINWALTWARYP